MKRTLKRWQIRLSRLLQHIDGLPTKDEIETLDYEAWRRHFLKERLRLGIVLALVLYLSFTVLEISYWRSNSDAFNINWLRMQLVVEVCLLLCLGLLQTPFGRRHPGVMFLIFSWLLGLSPQIRDTFSGVLMPSFLVWPLVFLGQATLISVYWPLHLLSQLGVLAYWIFGMTALNLDVQMPATFLTPSLTFLYMTWTALICDLSVFLYDRIRRSEFNARRALEKAYRTLESERDRSERLLLNILPHPIAERLKQQVESEAIADSFADAGVLFADIVGFTALSSHIEPAELVRWLNQIFSEFDRLADRHGLEKIKTIGDAYMVVSGLPVPREDCAEAIADMALDMQAALANFNRIAGQQFSIRIGIAIGPVVAGVIGIKKFIYDLWGDTVNLASRMESHGLADCIQVTEATYDRLQSGYVLEPRGRIPIKGKGELPTYLLRGKRSSPTEGLKKSQNLVE